MRVWKNCIPTNVLICAELIAAVFVDSPKESIVLACNLFTASELIVPVTDVTELVVRVLKNPNVAEIVLAFTFPNNAEEAVSELIPNELARPTDAVRELTPRVLAYATPSVAVVALIVKAVSELTPSVLALAAPRLAVVALRASAVSELTPRVLAFATPKLAVVAPRVRAVSELTPRVLADAPTKIPVVARRVLTPTVLMFAILVVMLDTVRELTLSVLNDPIFDETVSD